MNSLFWNSDDEPRPGFLDRVPQLGKDWLKVDKAVASYLHEHKTDLEAGQVVLTRHIAVDRHEHVEALFRKREK